MDEREWLVVICFLFAREEANTYRIGSITTPLLFHLFHNAVSLIVVYKNQEHTIKLDQDITIQDATAQVVSKFGLPRDPNPDKPVYRLRKYAANIEYSGETFDGRITQTLRQCQASDDLLLLSSLLSSGCFHLLSFILEVFFSYYESYFSVKVVALLV